MILCILEDKSYNYVDIPDCHIELVIVMKRVVEFVPNLDLRRWHFHRIFHSVILFASTISAILSLLVGGLFLG